MEEMQSSRVTCFEYNAAYFVDFVSLICVFFCLSDVIVPLPMGKIVQVERNEKLLVLLIKLYPFCKQEATYNHFKSCTFLEM